MNVFISGTSRGLGLSLANQLIAQGHIVYSISRSKPPIHSENFIFLNADITNDSCISAIQSLVKTVPIDILINNAGSGSFGSNLASLDFSEVTIQMQVHCLGMLRVTQALYKNIIKSNNPLIFNITSRLGSTFQHLRGDFNSNNFSYGYRIAKAAQNMATLCMQDDPSLSKCIIASINPGLLKTDQGAVDATHSTEEGAEKLISLISEITKNGFYHSFGEETYY